MEQRLVTIIGTRSKPSTSFRADIEGLRGIAVLAVVLYHFQLGVAPGGFVGVDIFFVLSGYLITGILYREAAHDGRVHFADFWARRVRRILPAAALVLLVSLVGVVVLVSPLDIRRAAGDIGTADIFMINWQLAWHAVDYLAQNNSPSVVLHYWSLAIEEQFYLFWPLVVALALVAHRLWCKIVVVKLLVVATLVLWAASFGISIYLVGRSAPFAFFTTIPRIWELLTGALIVFLVHGKKPLGSWFSAALGWAGLAAVVGAILLLSSATRYPGWPAILPTLGTAALIVTGAGAGPARLLTVPPLRFLGRVSYSWYLWHWPFTWFGRQAWPHMNLVGQLSLLAGSLLAGTASYYFVENPARYNPMLLRSARLSLAAGVVMISLSFGAASIVWWLYANPKILLHDGKTIAMQMVLDDIPRIYFDGCHISVRATTYRDCVFGVPSGANTVFLFGDSHAAQYFSPLESAAQQLGWRLVVRTKSSCPPYEATLWNFEYKREYYECEAWRQAVLSEIARTQPTLVIAAAASNYLFVDPATGRPREKSRATAAAGERSLASDLLRDAQAVVFVSDTPIFPEAPVRCVAKNPGHEEKCHWSLETILPNFRFPVAVGSLDPRVQVVDLAPDICEGGLCIAVKDGNVQYRDDQHLSASAAMALAPKFAEILKNAAPALQR